MVEGSGDRSSTASSLSPARRVKFTMLVSDEDDKRARRVVGDVIDRAGVRPAKSMRAEVVRALLRLADEDPRLRQRVALRLLQDLDDPADRGVGL